MWLSDAALLSVPWDEASLSEHGSIPWEVAAIASDGISDQAPQIGGLSLKFWYIFQKQRKSKTQNLDPNLPV